MASVGVRELKQHTSEVLRRVRENGETIEVTFRGRVVARLVPVEPRATRRRGRGVEARERRPRGARGAAWLMPWWTRVSG